MKVIKHVSGYEIHCSDIEFDILLGSVNVAESEGICDVPNGWTSAHRVANEARLAHGDFLRVDEDHRVI